MNEDLTILAACRDLTNTAACEISELCRLIVRLADEPDDNHSVLRGVAMRAQVLTCIIIAVLNDDHVDVRTMYQKIYGEQMPA